MKKQPGTDAHQAAVIAAFRETASVSRACKLANVARRQHYTWLDEDPEYAVRFEAAIDEAGQCLEDEAVRRAYRGVLEPVVFQGHFTFPVIIDPKTGEPMRDKAGRIVLSDKPLCIRKYSDSLLLSLLKAWKPAKYRETFKGEISGPGGGPISLTEERLRNLTDDQLAQLTALAKLLTGSQEPGSGSASPAAA